MQGLSWLSGDFSLWPTRTNVPCSAAKCSLAGMQRRSPLPKGESILVLVDYFSRFVKVAILKSTTSRSSKPFPICLPDLVYRFLYEQTTDRNLCQKNLRHFFVCMVLNIVRLRHYGRKLMEKLNLKIVPYLNVYRLHIWRRKIGV